MVEDPEAVLEDWYSQHPIKAGEYMSLSSTSSFRQEQEKHLEFLPPKMAQIIASQSFMKPAVTREFLSSDSDTENENKTEESASETAEKLIEEMKLTDSGSEAEEKKSEMDTEVKMLEAEINKKDVQMKTPEEVEMELEELDNKMQKEEEAIKELERKIEDKRAGKEMICGGLKLDMQWKLVPLTLNIEPSGRQEWLSKIYEEQDEENATLKLHPNVPLKNTRCRKCRQQYHTSKDCPNSGSQLSRLTIISKF